MSSLVFVGATTLGSTVGYELSAAFADTAPPTIAGRRVSPVAVATPGGAQLASSAASDPAATESRPPRSHATL